MSHTQYPNKTLTETTVRVWETPGDNLLARFTVAIRWPDGYHGVYGMSWGGDAFDQYVGEAFDSTPWPGGIVLGPELGRELRTIPRHLREAIATRIVEPITQQPIRDACTCHNKLPSSL